jgi:integrase
LINIQSITSDQYIFPLLSNEKKNITQEYNEVSSKNAIINKELKAVAKRMDIAPFSFHAARHSFANNIREVEPDILKISRMLGHHSLSQTQDYLKRFERTEGYVSNDRFIGLHDDFFLG